MATAAMRISVTACAVWRQVNRWLLGYRPTLAWLERLPRGLREPVHIVDVGSGGGDLLRQIAGWARRRGIAVQLTGIDLNPYAARAAAESTPKELGITWVTGDALVYRPEKPMDIVVSSLMAHHLEDEEIVALLRWMEATAQVGWFINDLERAEWSSRMFGWVRRPSGAAGCLGGCGIAGGTGLCGMMGRCRSGGPSGRRIGYGCWLRLRFRERR